jgi:hypothetical protein
LRPIDRRSTPALYPNALDWEAEALLAGLVMTEWGLARALGSG